MEPLRCGGRRGGWHGRRAAPARGGGHVVGKQKWRDSSVLCRNLRLRGLVRGREGWVGGGRGKRVVGEVAEYGVTCEEMIQGVGRPAR